MSPIVFHWDGEAMVPEKRFARACDAQFVIGESYPLIVNESRSAASHNHYFAAIHEGWQNLPEEIAERFATPEHLRKFALIKAGYRDERTFVASSKAEAQRLAAFVRPMDEFSVVLVDEASVTVFTAKSQSLKAMGRKAFQESKDAVLDVIAGLIGVAPKDLSNHAGRMAA